MSFFRRYPSFTIFQVVTMDYSDRCLISSSSALSLSVTQDDFALNDTSIPQMLKVIHCQAKGQVFCPSEQSVGFCISESNMQTLISERVGRDSVSCMCMGLQHCINSPYCHMSLCIIAIMIVLGFTLSLLRKFKQSWAFNIQIFNWGESLQTLVQSSTPNCLPCLDGVRSIALVCVMAGHMRQILSKLYTTPPEIQADGSKSYSVISIVILHNMDLAVDAFLLLGGLLNALSWKRQTKHTKDASFWTKYIGLRWVRLAPPIIFTLLIENIASRTVMPEMFMGSQREELSCSKTWWSLPLFINNYVNNECARWTWYLGLDMQLHLLSPLILIPLQSAIPKLGLGITAIATIISLIRRGTIVSDHGISILHSADAPVHDELMQVLYSKPLPRLFPYLIGVVVGSHLPAIIHTVQTMKYKSSIMSYFATMAIIWSVISPFPQYYQVFETIFSENALISVLSLWHHILYLTLFRVAFSLAVLWLTLLCLSNQLPSVDEFLSHHFFTFLSRISFYIYLIHTIVFGFLLQYVFYPLLPFTLNVDVVTIFLFPFWFAVVIVCSVLLHLITDGITITLRHGMFTLIHPDYKNKKH